MKGKKGAVARSEYAHLRRVFYRMGRTGEMVDTYWDDQGTVYVKTFGDHIRIEKVSEDQFTNAVINHDLYIPGEDRSPSA